MSQPQGKQRISAPDDEATYVALCLLIVVLANTVLLCWYAVSRLAF